MSSFFVHESAYVDEGANIGEGTKIWHFSHILAGAKIGCGCILGQNAHVANDVVIGNNVKIQKNVSIYKGTIVEDDVFLGPSCVLTNVTNPRSQVNRHALYETTLLRRGATIGANATIVCGVTIGRYAFIGAGAVVNGHRLLEPNEKNYLICPESGFKYKLDSAGKTLKCLDLDEDSPLPENLNKGTRSYDEFKPDNHKG